MLLSAIVYPSFLRHWPTSSSSWCHPEIARTSGHSDFPYIFIFHPKAMGFNIIFREAINLWMISGILPWFNTPGGHKIACAIEQTCPRQPQLTSPQSAEKHQTDPCAVHIKQPDSELHSVVIYVKSCKYPAKPRFMFIGGVQYWGEGIKHRSWVILLIVLVNSFLPSNMSW